MADIKLDPTHWGMPTGLTLCGSTSDRRWTTVRNVACIYCLNRIDRFLSDRLKQLEAANRHPDTADTGKA